MTRIKVRSNSAIAHVALWGRQLLAAIMVVMAASSYLAYSTVGFDFERESPAGVEVVYYRLRWDDGATWIGRSVQPIPRPDQALDWFDPGGTLLAAPSRPEHPLWWNRLGFWWITRAADDPYVALRYPGATASCWVAVPSWLVVALAGIAGRATWFRTRRLP